MAFPFKKLSMTECIYISARYPIALRCLLGPSSFYASACPPRSGFCCGPTWLCRFLVAVGWVRGDITRSLITYWGLAGYLLPASFVCGYWNLFAIKGGGFGVDIDQQNVVVVTITA